MLRLFVSCIILIIASSCGSRKNTFNPSRKFPAHQLKSDLFVLKSTLEANHPSLYWYTSKDSLNNSFNLIYNSINDSLTEAQFKNKVAWWVSKIHCGHTSTRFSKEYVKYFEKKKLPQFPLNLKVWGDSAVLINNLLKDSVLKRGDIILSINGKSLKNIVDSICTLMSTDGFTNNFKYQAISFNFPSFYKNTFGLDSQYVVSFLDSNGLEKRHQLKNYIPKIDTGKITTVDLDPIAKKRVKEMTLNSQRSLKVDTLTQSAIMEVNTFSKGRLRKFFKESFHNLSRNKIENLVIDLRRNTGGSISKSTRLTQYLAAQPFRIADSVVATGRKFRNRKYIRNWLVYWFSLHLAGRKSNDGKIHFRYFENHFFNPKKKNHFDKNIFLLTGGYTFSASTLVVNNLKGQSNVMIIGEETGGGSYGNSAIHIPDIVLPNTKVRVRLPIFRIVLNANKEKTGRGIFPDVEVPPSSYHIRKGVDAKMEKVRHFIKTENALIR